jgi:hypothetical protein
MIPPEIKTDLDAAFATIMNTARHYPGGNLARFIAEQQVEGMVKTLRFTKLVKNDDFCLEKLVDEYQMRIKWEMNF